MEMESKSKGLTVSGGGVGPALRGAAKRKTGSAMSSLASSNGSSSSSSSSSLGAISKKKSFNDSEIQLYRVLQRANLLAYYETFIAQGGDDVHQLCEAGEEEFLEIMALVGMASKPLHVRRLQKALQDWVQNPELFQETYPSSIGYNASSSSSVHCKSHLNTSPTQCASSSNVRSVSSLSASLSPSVSSKDSGIFSSLSKDSPSSSSSPPNSSLDYPSESTSPFNLTPLLVESQIQRIAETADALIKSLPPTFEPKVPTNKKKISKELEVRNYVLSMSDDDPRKMEEIRRFSAIYGRFDCKRKPEKPLTLHEVSVNEAAAQLCCMMPTLLTRRDELFPLARQVVRDSGYQYSKGHSRSQFSTGFPSKLFGVSVNSVGGSSGNGGHISDDEYNVSNKKIRLTSEQEEKGREFVDEIRQLGEQVDELRGAACHARDSGDSSTHISLNQRIDYLQAKQTQLIQEQNDYSRYFRSRYSGRTSTCSDNDRPDTDDDSQLSYSNTSSPSAPQGSSNVPQHAGSYILSASGGGQIIAVSNPALSLSSTLLRNPSSTCESNGPASVVTSSSGRQNLLNLSLDKKPNTSIKLEPLSPTRKNELL